MTKESKQELKTEVTPPQNRTPWAPAQKGILVEKGMTFKDLSQAQRQAHFAKHEATWKTKYNANRGTVNAQQNFTRG